MAQDIEDPKFEIKWIGPSSYRKLIPPEQRFKCEVNRYQDDEEEDAPGELDDEMEYEGDEWKLKLFIPVVFHKFIIGGKAVNKKRLEMESGARIVIPSREDSEDAIWLHARHKQQIYSCKAQIELQCEKDEARIEYTHFLSVPLAHAARFRQEVDRFRENVVMQHFQGIDASIFMPTKRMHFTMCMLKLHSHAQVEEMKEALRQIEASLSKTADYTRPLAANMKGLHIMTDDPSNVGVVFTTDRSHDLQNRMNSLSDMIFDILKQRKLVSEQNLMSQRLLSSDGRNAEVKLHATLMNTKYSKAGWQRDGYGRGERESFDASVLMETFGQVDFGTVPLREIQFSCLDEMGDDGYYRSLFNMPLCDPKVMPE